MFSKQYGWGTTKTTKYDSTIITQRWVSILLCRLRIGDKYVNEIIADNLNGQLFEWSDDPNSTFTLAVKPHGIDPGQDPTDFLIGQTYDIMNGVTMDMNIEASGLCIPIKHDDKIQGDIEFQIIAPFNDLLNTTNHYYKHGTWFRDAVTYDTENDICILNHVHSINIEDFNIKAYSDNAKNATMNSGDLLYYSEDAKNYNNTKEGIEFKITTALTSEQAAALGVANGVSFNNPTNDDGSLYTTEDTDTARPERKYIKTMYDLYSTPKKIVTYETEINDMNVDKLYRTVYTCDLMAHLGVENFKVMVLGDEMDLKNNRTKLTIREN